MNGKDTVDNVAVEQTVEKFTIDTVEPQLKNMSFDNNNVVNGCYYTSGRTLTITVEERNCDESSFEFNLLGSP